MLVVDSLTVRYGHAVAVRDVSLSVARGEVVAVLGANGAGKSSLGRGIAGITRGSGGIRLADEEIGALDSAARVRRGLVYVPEGRHVFPQLTVEENLRAGGFVRRRGGGWRTRRDAMYDRVPRLAERSGIRAGLLSGGEQQLLAICRAMMAEPTVLVLDEPSLGLAPVAIDAVVAFLGELCADGALTVLLLEQNVAFATRSAERAYLMRLGEMYAEAPRAVIAEPQRVVELLSGAGNG